MDGGSGGDDDLIPLPGQEIIICYKCHLENGLEVDNSEKHEQSQGTGTKWKGIKVCAGMGQVIEGWDMGLLTMRLGEKSDLYIKAKYAFGDEGRPPKIPGGAPVIFTVEVLQVGERKSRAYNRSQLKDETLLAEATTKKADGNAKFKEKEFQDAVDSYAEGIEIIGYMQKQDTEETKLLKVQLH